METTNFTAPDITCGGCANAIKKALGALPGVSEVAVDIDTKVVKVTHESTISEQALRTTLDKAGFPILA